MDHEKSKMVRGINNYNVTVQYNFNIIIILQKLAHMYFAIL